MKDLSNAVKPHRFTAKLMHWAFLILYLYGLTKQLDDVAQLEDSSLLWFEMAFAALFLMVLLIRYIYMRVSGPTALPLATSKLVKVMARSGHLALYLSLSMIAVTGLLIGGLYWLGNKSGLVMDIVVRMHEISVTASFLFIGLHVMAALFHRLRGDGIWTAMVPFWKETTNE